MLKTTISCRTTAPLFLYGAENKGGGAKPEIRAASIKGNMRFIWRAVQQADSIEQLREKEGDLFGNAYGGKFTKQSEVRIRISQSSCVVKSSSMVPHRGDKRYKMIGGTKASFSSKSIEEGTSFKVIITSFGDEPSNDGTGKESAQKIKHLKFVRLFVVTCLLYGFGRRSRKGFGTVAITEIEGTGKDIVGYSIDDLECNLNKISEYGAEYSGQSTGTITDKNAQSGKNMGKYPYIERVVLFKKVSSQTYSNKEQLKNLRIDAGLTFHNHASKKFLGFSGRETDKEKRFASSVIVSTVSEKNGDIYLVATQLNCLDDYKPSESDLIAFYEELERGPKI